MHPKTAIRILQWCCVYPTLAWADTVVLKDGSALHGDVTRVGGNVSIKLGDGTTRYLNADAVKSVSIATTQSSATANVGSGGSAAKLASLRRSVEAVKDIDQIIDRYQRFIESGIDDQTRAAADADLNQWRQRNAAGQVKLGAKWVTPVQADEARQHASLLADDARSLLRQNKAFEADAAIRQALSEDPGNFTALFLRGVILYRSDKLPDARKAFEAVHAGLPRHVPTLNNLAVILARQNAAMPAVGFYDQTMQASGVNKFVLDNVSEMLAGLGEDQRKNSVVLRALRRFAELDQALQQQQAQRGLYRWGSNWVTQQQIDDIKASEKDVRAQLAAIQKDFDLTKQKIATNAQQIADNQRTMADLQLRSVYTDTTGRSVAIPLPRIYYDLKSTNTQLAADVETLNAKLAEFQDQVRQAQSKAPVPTFTGIQQLVGVEGTPGPDDLPMPATLPAATEADAAPTSQP